MKKKERSYTCPCCNFLTLAEGTHDTFEICPVCNWEDDEEFFKKLIPFAQNIVFGFIMSHNPEVIKQPLRNELIKKRILFPKTEQKPFSKVIVNFKNIVPKHRMWLL